MEPPEALRPQVVKGLDGRVIIGLAQGNEQDLNAHVQTQAYHSAEHPGMMAAAQCAFIVKLGHVGHPELLPSLQSVLTSGGGGFVGMRGGVGVVTIDIDGVEGLDNFAPRDPTGNDVGGVDGIGIGGQGMRAIGPTTGRWRLGGEMMTLEHPLNGTQAGRGLWVAMTPLLLKGAGSPRGKAQTRLAVSHQELAQADDAPLALGREGLGRMVGRTGSRAKAGPRMLGAIGHPFIDPTPAVVKLPCDF